MEEMTAPPVPAARDARWRESLGVLAVHPWVAVAAALTLLDAVATSLWLELGVAAEGNPLLAALVEALGAVPAMVVRAVVGVTLLVALAALTVRSRLARLALPAVTLVLAAVAVWHVVGAVGPA